jgi:ABC-type lipopolysaccharide export system ATPase subunit
MAAVPQALAVAHRGYGLEGGQIVLAGPAKALKEDPKIRDAYLGGSALNRRTAENPKDKVLLER